MDSVFNLISRLTSDSDVMNDYILSAVDALLSVTYGAFSVDPTLLCPFSNSNNIISICKTLEKFLDRRRYSLALRVTVVLSRLCLYSSGSLPYPTIAATLLKLCDLPIEYFIDENFSDEVLASFLAIAYSSDNFSELCKALHPSYFKNLLSLADEPLHKHRVAVISRIFPSSLWAKFQEVVETTR